MISLLYWSWSHYHVYNSYPSVVVNCLYHKKRLRGVDISILSDSDDIARLSEEGCELISLYGDLDGGCAEELREGLVADLHSKL